MFPQAEVERICTVARELKVASFLDGARLWNAAVTHLDVTRQECERAARVLARLANGGAE